MDAFVRRQAAGAFRERRPLDSVENGPQQRRQPHDLLVRATRVPSVAYNPGFVRATPAGTFVFSRTGTAVGSCFAMAVRAPVRTQ